MRSMKKLWQFVFIVSAVLLVVLAVPAFVNTMADPSPARILGRGTGKLMLALLVLWVGRYREPALAGKCSFNVCLILALLGRSILLPSILAAIALWFFPRRVSVQSATIPTDAPQKQA